MPEPAASAARRRSSGGSDGAVNATRGLLGIASSFHIFTPQFLTLALLATAGCLLLALGGLVSLVVLATG